MSDKNDNDKNVTVSIAGLWVVGWMFTIGYAKLTVGWGILALVVWPVLLGGAAR